MVNRRLRPARPFSMEDLRSSLREFSLAHYKPLRDQDPPRHDAAVIEQLVKDEVDGLMPIVLRMREESGATGPVTEDEYFQASMTRSEQTSHAVLRQIQARAGEVDGWRGTFLQTFLASAEADLADLATLKDDPTEERLQAVADRLVERSNALTQKLKDRNSE
ncbi:MAG: hypothetical protein ACO1SV_09100 [Fimbriimonas sp.]